MAMKKAKQKVSETAGLARFMPAQKRSRERFEHILSCTEDLLKEKGGDGFRMSDLVVRTGVPFGSLYQYFPDKSAVIATLAGRYNELGRACVAEELTGVESEKDLWPALQAITEGYYRMFREHPVMRDIWQATQADHALRRIDEEDGEFLSALLAEAVRRVEPDADAQAVTAFSQLMMTLIAACVRHAIALKPREADRMLALFKQMLPKKMATMT